MQLYHVYIDRKPGGTPFYVGKGLPSRIRNVDRNAWHKNICNKHPGWYREVVETASDALCKEFEMFLISEIGRRDLGLGPLVNLTDGGEGVTNLSPESSESRRVKTVISWRDESVRAARLSYDRKIHGEKSRASWTAERRARQSIENSDRYKDPAFAKSASDRAKEFQSSEEYRSNMRKSVSKAWEDPVLRQKQSDNMVERKWMNKDGKSMRALPETVNQLLEDGWVYGRGSKKRD